uniref:cholesterol 7-desaturase n=1 Tax=Eptatretus burgeri TaxID=7764 RepID=A0A8C4QVF0_EPTBU
MWDHDADRWTYWTLGIALLVFLAHLFLLRLCCRPSDVRRSPYDVGYLPRRTHCGDWDTKNLTRRRHRRGSIPPHFPNGWYRVLDSRDLRLTALCPGEQLAVFRADEGQVSIFHAYCPHLGANLAMGGKVRGNCLECPFHGWRFRAEDGKCVEIPYARKVPEFARTKVWPSCEMNGLIYMWYHCDGIEPEWNVPKQEEVVSGEWVFRGRTEHYITAHIQEIPENAADFAHLQYVHTPFVLGGANLQYTCSWLWRTFRHCSLMNVEHSLTFCGRKIPGVDLKVQARQVGPALVYLNFKHPVFGQGIILQCVTPVEPLLQQVTHHIYYKSTIPPIIPKILLHLERIQFERDVYIWNNKTYMKTPLLISEDSPIGRHRRWYSQFYTEKSKRSPPQQNTLEW